MNSLVRVRLFNTSPGEIWNNKGEKLWWEVLYVWLVVTCGKNGRRIKQTTKDHIKSRSVMTAYALPMHCMFTYSPLSPFSLYAPWTLISLYF